MKKEDKFFLLLVQLTGMFITMMYVLHYFFVHIQIWRHGKAVLLAPSPHILFYVELCVFFPLTLIFLGITSYFFIQQAREI